MQHCERRRLFISTTCLGVCQNELVPPTTTSQSLRFLPFSFSTVPAPGLRVRWVLTNRHATHHCRHATYLPPKTPTLKERKGTLAPTYPRHSMGLAYLPISWGGFGGQCRHIWHTWSVWVLDETHRNPAFCNPKSFFGGGSDICLALSKPILSLYIEVVTSASLYLRVLVLV